MEVGFARRARELLEAGGLDVEYHESDAAHHIDPAHVDAGGRVARHDARVIGLARLSAKSEGEVRMADSVYRVTEVIGVSTESWEAAARSAVETAAKSVRDLRIAEVVRQDVTIGDGGVVNFRVRLAISFKFEGASSSASGTEALAWSRASGVGSAQHQVEREQEEEHALDAVHGDREQRAAEALGGIGDEERVERAWRGSTHGTCRW